MKLRIPVFFFSPIHPLKVRKVFYFCWNGLHSADLENTPRFSFIPSAAESGTWSSILSESGSGSESRALMTKNAEKNLSFWSKIAIYVFLGLLKVRPSYRGSIQSSKENIQHFKKLNLLTFSGFVDHFCPPGSGSGLRIRKQGSHRIRIESGSAHYFFIGWIFLTF